MNEKNYSKKIKDIVAQFEEMLKNIEIATQNYEKVFSDDFNKRTLLANNDTKKIVLLYYEYISHITSLLYSFENSISDLSCIIIEAEKSIDMEGIDICDKILCDYNGFKNEFGEFIKKCEGEISKTKGEPSVIFMKQAIEQLHRKNIFIRENFVLYQDNDRS